MFGLSGFFRKHYFPAASLLLIIVFAFLLLSTAFSMSALWDEPPTLAIGYYTLKTSDFGLNYHPPLGFEIMALPLLFLEPQPQIPPNAASYSDYSYLAFITPFFSSIKDVGTAVFAARLVPIFLALLLAVLVLVWAARLYGKAAGLLALAVFALNPVIIGNMSVATNDVPVAFFFTLAFFLFWRFVTSPSMRRLLLVAAVFAFAVLSKLTAFFIMPIIFFIWLFVWNKEKSFPLRLPGFILATGFLRKLYHFAMLLAVFGIVFLFFGLVFYRGQFDTVGSSLPERHLEKVLSFAQRLPHPVGGLAEAALAKLSVPFPSFFASIAEIAGISTFAHKPSFLFGEVYDGGKPQYFLLEFLFKTPIPLLLLFLLAALSLFKMKLLKPAELFLIIPPLIYFVLMLPNKENFGIRHLLPIYPFLAIFSGRLVKAFRHGRLLPAALLPLFLWLLISVAGAHPSHYSYFNEFAGGSANGHNVMVLNSDQGQGLKLLKQYMSDNGIGSVKLSYFGSIDPALYDINYSYLPSPYWQPWVPDYAPSQDSLQQNYSEDCTEKIGVMAISLTNLKGVGMINRSCFSWLKSYRPVADIGHSMFVYNIPESSAQHDVRQGAQK